MKSIDQRMTVRHGEWKPFTVEYRDPPRKYRGRWCVVLRDGRGVRFRSKRRAIGYARKYGGTLRRFHGAKWRTPMPTPLYDVTWLAPEVVDVFARHQGDL